MNRKIYNNPNPSLAQGILNGVSDPSVKKESWSKKECETKIRR